MKYLSYELHVAQNKESLNDNEQEKLDSQWVENAETYKALYNTLSERLPKDIFNRFNSWGFHDYKLIKIEIEHKSLIHSNVYLTVSDDDVWILSFKSVSYFQFQHLNYDNDKSLYNREIDEWLFEEILPLNESMLSFEVVFSSGGNILLHFSDKLMSIEKVS